MQHTSGLKTEEAQELSGPKNEMLRIIIVSADEEQKGKLFFVLSINLHSIVGSYKLTRKISNLSSLFIGNQKIPSDYFYSSPSTLEKSIYGIYEAQR